MSKVHQFLTRYPSVDGFTLIQVCEEINRRTGAAIGVDGILRQALLIDSAGEYLASVCEGFQNQPSIPVKLHAIDLYFNSL